jgi:hypothetical protein
MNMYYPSKIDDSVKRLGVISAIRSKLPNHGVFIAKNNG